MLIQKLKLLSLVSLLGLSVSGCSQKEIVYETKLVCHKQSMYEKPELDIFVAEEDYKNLNDFLDVNDSAHLKYQEQVLRNNERCEKDR